MISADREELLRPGYEVCIGKVGLVVSHNGMKQLNVLDWLIK